MRRYALRWVIGVVLWGTPGVMQAQMPETPADSAKVWYSIGKDYLLKKRYDDAIRNFKRALSYNDTFSLAYLDLAQAYLGKAQQVYEESKNGAWKTWVDSARAVYETMTKKLPHDSRSYQGLGYLYGVVLKERDSGLVYYQKAVEMDSSNTAAAFGLAKLLADMGRAKEADSLFQAIIAKDTSVAFRGAYGMFLVDQKRYEEAFAYLEEALQAYPDNRDLLMRYVDAALEVNQEKVKKQGVLRKALTYLDRLIKQSPRDASLYLKRSKVYESLGQVSQAIKDLDQVLTLSPNYVPALLKKAALLVDSKQYDQAEVVLKQLLSLPEVQNNPAYQAASLSLRGYVYYVWGWDKYKTRAWADAEETFKQAKSFYTTCAQLSSPYAQACQDGIAKAEKMEKKAYRKKVGIE